MTNQKRLARRAERTPNGAARAKRRAARVFKRPAKLVDANCVSLPDGDCVATEPCMHTELPGCPEAAGPC